MEIPAVRPASDHVGSATSAPTSHPLSWPSSGATVLLAPGDLASMSAADQAAEDSAARRRASAWPSALVAEAMSRPVLTIETTETLWDAWQLLSVSGLRHLAVVDDETCVGVISDRNILSDVPVSQERMRARLVSQVVSPGTNRCVTAGEHLAEVARLMSRYSVEAVPVVDAKGRLMGIVTGSDLVRWWAAEPA